MSRAPALAKRLAALLHESGTAEVVDGGHDVEHVLGLVDRLELHAVVIDSSVAPAHGLELARKARARAHVCLIVVLLLQVEPSIADEYREAGAHHVLSQHADFERVVELVRLLRSPSPTQS